MKDVDLDVEVVRLSVVNRNQEHVTRSCLLFELKNDIKICFKLDISQIQYTCAKENYENCIFTNMETYIVLSVRNLQSC